MKLLAIIRHALNARTDRQGLEEAGELARVVAQGNLDSLVAARKRELHFERLPRAVRRAPLGTCARTRQSRMRDGGAAACDSTSSASFIGLTMRIIFVDSLEISLICKGTRKVHGAECRKNTIFTN